MKIAKSIKCKGESRLPNYRYSIQTDPDRSAKSSGRNLDVSPKAAREICKAIKGKSVHKCIEYLEAVIEKKQAIPYRRYKRDVAHKRGLVKWKPGRYPIKAAKAILKIVRNLENNAEKNQLQLDKCNIIHAATLQGVKQRGIFYRAHGRSSPKIRQLVHVELIAEVEEV